MCRSSRFVVVDLRALRAPLIMLAAIASFMIAGLAPASGASCNLVPNGRFEQGTSTTFSGWGAVPSGQVPFTVSNYPEEVQSGSRAVSINISSAGDRNFATLPERTSIPALPNTQYAASARLFSSNGERAALRVIEWNNNLAVADRFLEVGGGTGQWVTLDGVFTTKATTNHISIRLVHHVDAGTFVWDDIALWQHTPGQHCVDVRHHVTQSTPGFMMCREVNNSIVNCVDGNRDGDEFVVNYGNGIRDYYSHNGDGLGSDPSIGVHKNLSAPAVWRCFADPFEDCGDQDGTSAHFPPHTLPVSAMLPILSTTPPINGRTPGAHMIHDWQEYSVNRLNPFDGSQPARIGNITGRRWAFVASSVSFGGDLGTHSNVLVFESEVVGNGIDPIPFGGGQRLERYYFVPGFGRVQERGIEDSDCRASPGPLTCDGVYDVQSPGIATFNQREDRDFTFELNAPFGSTDWW